MISFKTFLIETYDDQHVGHMTHFEDAGHESGHAGAEHSLAALEGMHDHIASGKNNSQLSTKVDGGLSVLTGRHPTTGKPFVAYKGAIGNIGTEHEKGILHSHADIDKHFKDKPYLKDKMKTVLDHAHKVLPYHGVYQGDVLHTGEKGDVKHDKSRVSVTPNTITYSAKKGSTEGKKLADSKLGIAFHTVYHKDEHGGLHALPVDHADFKHHDDVYNLSTSNDTARAHYPLEKQAEFKNHLEAAKQIHNTGSHEMYRAVSPMGDHIGTHINKTVREGNKPSTEGLKSHIHSQYQKQIDKLKTEKGKSGKIAQRDSQLRHVDTHANHFDNYFKMHGHVQAAKNTLVHVLNKADYPLEHHIDGKKTQPEGYVSYHSGKPLKAVDRSEFSAANFAKARD